MMKLTLLLKTKMISFISFASQWDKVGHSNMQFLALPDEIDEMNCNIDLLDQKKKQL